MLEAVAKEVPRCIWYFRDDKAYVKTHDGSTNVERQKFNHTFYYKEDGKKKSITFEDLALDPNSNIAIYSREVLQPNKEDVQIYYFNLFSRFEADVDIEDFTEEKYKDKVNE